MPVTSSAIYDTARYGQARYGRILITATSVISFTTQGTVIGWFYTSGTSSLTFTNSAYLSDLQYLSGSSLIEFDLFGRLYADGKLSGNISTTFSFTTNILGHEAPYEYNILPSSGNVYTGSSGALGSPFSSYGVLNTLPLYIQSSGTLGSSFPQYNIVNTNKPFEEEN